MPTELFDQIKAVIEEMKKGEAAQQNLVAFISDLNRIIWQTLQIMPKPTEDLVWATKFLAEAVRQAYIAS